MPPRADRVDDVADVGTAGGATGRLPAIDCPPSSVGLAGGGGSAWRVVVGFGVVSLAADMAYEGARSVYGPLLASLGASAVVVGLVTGAGEAAALLLRLVSGPLADRTRRYWWLTILGYGLTAVCVPLLAVTPLLGGAGLAVAAALILAERLGKAIRSPAKSALLADAASRVGLGRGLGVHKALDQVGAFAGPLLVAAVVAMAAGSLTPGLAVLTVPGLVAMLLLLAIRARAEGLPAAGRATASVSTPVTGRRPLPARFHLFAAAMALCTAGLVTFGLIGFHLVRAGVVAPAAVPLMYAAAMAAGALAALVTGVVYDRAGPWVLLALPALIAAVPALVFGGGLPLAVGGVVVWGAAVGVQDSTVKALVADLVPRERRATAYGVFAAVQGAGALAGGAAAGGLYEFSLASLVVAVAVTQAAALVVLVGVLATARPASEARRRHTAP
ncbi:MFS transporter [Micromonospora sp. NBC_00389]|uniref:MFS transporter n=1 Tax=Micromonospora sp. NBC_00389 TaxID=2903586 RepID=UPI002E1FBB43